jgi:hypothetical protein
MLHACRSEPAGASWYQHKTGAEARGFRAAPLRRAIQRMDRERHDAR